MIGQTISHYKILEKIGEGGMGKVYLAEDTSLGRKVAVKVLSADKAADPESRKRFVHEAKSQAILSHHNIATFHEVGEERDKVFIVMEYIEGQPLSKLGQAEKLSLPEILDLATQVGEGLRAAHEKGVMHRDINPTNILVTSKRMAKITDFGLAWCEGVSKITPSGVLMGTDPYISPELITIGKADYRTDIFSLGVVLYELLCARRPFEGDNREALFYEILYVVPQPLARFCRNLPDQLEKIVMKCLAKRPEERYQSAADLVADLKALRRAMEAAGLPGTSAKSSRKSVAVLPLKNLSGRKENEYFSDGVTEDIITQLSKIGELKVISRTSVMQYKNTRKNLREIAKELDVATILEGSVRQKGGRVRIVGQLIDARTDELLWAETYDREMKDIFEIQSDVARQIAAALQAKLSAPEKKQLAKAPTGNLTAYDYYLKGREYYYRYHKQDNENAIALFKKALELDSDYALAYAGLGDAYSLRVSSFGFSPAWADAAIEVSQKAISIDPNQAEGYGALGRAYFRKGWSRKALEAHRKAVELNPNNSWSLGSIGGINLYIGEFEEASRWMKKAVAVNPTNANYYIGVGDIYFILDDDAKAEEWFKKALELQPDSIYAHVLLSYMYMAQGKYEQALEWGQKILSIYPDRLACLYAAGDVEFFRGNYDRAEKYYQKVIAISSAEGELHLGLRHTTAALGYIYRKTGKPEDAQKMFDQSFNLAQKELEQGSEWNFVPFELATINASLGNQAEAYRWLQRAIDAGWRDYRWGLKDPRLENLHNDEKFKQMMAEVKAKVDEMRRRVEGEETGQVRSTAGF